MDTILALGKGMRVYKSDIDRASEAILITIKKELPEEAFFIEAIELVLEECKESLKYKKICL